MCESNTAGAPTLKPPIISHRWSTVTSNYGSLRDFSSWSFITHRTSRLDQGFLTSPSSSKVFFGTLHFFLNKNVWRISWRVRAVSCPAMMLTFVAFHGAGCHVTCRQYLFPVLLVYSIIYIAYRKV